MVAMLILVVGALAVVAMLETGIISTSRTSAREQGTNLARELVERSRQVGYTTITPAGAASSVAAKLPETPAVTGTTFTLTRRHVTYTVSLTACSIDDPSDGAGVGDATFCAFQTGSGGAGSASTTTAASVNVLGIGVSAGGSLLSTVCSAVGTNTVLLSTVTAAVSTLIPISVCSATGGTVPFDNHPDDLRRVRVDVSWTSGKPGSVSQTTLLTNPNQSA
jgi:hypothetical protein